MDIIGKDALSVDVGQRLKDLREERDISMRTLAKRSGLSANALSMIERGLASPSVSTLNKLADALGVPITAFFRAEPTRFDVVFRKAAERPRVPFMRGLWEGLGGEEFSGHIEAFMLTLENGGSSGVFGIKHTGHEFVLCLRGSIEYQVDGSTYLMNAGDSLLFAANLDHRWRNPGPVVASVVVVISDFEKNEHPGDYHLASATPDGEGQPGLE